MRVWRPLSLKTIFSLPQINLTIATLNPPYEDPVRLHQVLYVNGLSRAAVRADDSGAPRAQRGTNVREQLDTSIVKHASFHVRKGRCWRS